jgi:hypothetical protein
MYESPVLISGTDRFLNVTLTAYPMSDFDYPGFYIQEYIPYDMSVISTTADFSEYKDHTLTIISLLPTYSSVSYKLKLPSSDIKDASIIGVFRDENKTKYDIPETKISYRFNSISDSSTHSFPLNPTPTPHITIAKSINSTIVLKDSTTIELPAKPSDTESIFSFIFTPSFFILFTLILSLPILLYFKTKFKSFIILKEISFSIKDKKLTLDSIPYPENFTISISNPSKRAYLAHIQDKSKTFSIPNNDTCLLSHSSVTFSLKLLKTEDASGILIICGR